MNLKLKQNYEEALIYVPQLNSNILGKFIDSNLYSFLYKKYPDLFEVQEAIVKKTTIKTNDISFNNNTEEGNSSI
jgi:hypothetical protein